MFCKFKSFRLNSPPEYTLKYAALEANLSIWKFWRSILKCLCA